DRSSRVQFVSIDAATFACSRITSLILSGTTFTSLWWIFHRALINSFIISIGRRLQLVGLYANTFKSSVGCLASLWTPMKAVKVALVRSANLFAVYSRFFESFLATASVISVDTGKTHHIGIF